MNNSLNIRKERLLMSKLNLVFMKLKIPIRIGATV
jgi:hypothetical protein